LTAHSDKYITRDELRAQSDNDKRIAGCALADAATGRGGSSGRFTGW
jgi:hypothetical protein